MFVGAGGGFLQVAWGAYGGEVGLFGLLGHWFVPFWGYFSAPERCLKYPVEYCTLVLLKSSQEQGFTTRGQVMNDEEKEQATIIAMGVIVGLWWSAMIMICVATGNI